MTEYLEYLKVFRFSGDFGFLGQTFRKRRCHINILLLSPVLWEFKKIYFVHI